MAGGLVRSKDTRLMAVAYLLATAHYDDDGVPQPQYQAASRILDIPLTTLRTWYLQDHTTIPDEVVDEIIRTMWTRTKRTCSRRLWQAWQDTLSRYERRVNDDSVYDSHLQRCAVSLGILTEKALLIAGDATMRSDARVVHGRVILPDKVPLAQLADATVTTMAEHREQPEQVVGAISAATAATTAATVTTTGVLPDAAAETVHTLPGPVESHGESQAHAGEEAGQRGYREERDEE